MLLRPSSTLSAPVPRLPSLGSNCLHDATASLGSLGLLVTRWRHPRSRVIRLTFTFPSQVPGLSLPSNLIFVFVPVLALIPIPMTILVPVPIPMLVPVPTSTPAPVPVTGSSLPSLGPGSSVSTTSSDRRRVLHPKLRDTFRLHLLFTEIMSRAEWYYSVWSITLLILISRYGGFQSSPPLLSRSRSHSHIHCCPRLRLYSCPRCRPHLRFVLPSSPPFPFPSPLPSPSPFSSPSAPSHPTDRPGYPLDKMRVHRQRLLRTVLLGTRKGHSLSAEMMSCREPKRLMENRRESHSFLQMPGLVGVYLQLVLYPSDCVLLIAGR